MFFVVECRRRSGAEFFQSGAGRQADPGDTIAAQESLWQESMNYGKNFTAQGRFAEAERSYLIALEETRTFGEKDPRLLSTGMNLQQFTKANPNTVS